MQQRTNLRPFSAVMAESQKSQATPLQREWAAPTGRFFQGYVVDGLLGAFQAGAHARDPDMIPLFDFDDENLRASARKTADDLVNEVDRNYDAARATAGQDISGTDWLRLSGNMLSPTPGSKLKAGPSFFGKALQKGLLDAARSMAIDPVNTENGESFERQKLEKAAFSAAVGAAMPIARSGAAKIVDPKIAAGPRGLLEANVPLTLGQTLGGVTQRLENRLAALPVIGPPIRAAQQRSADGLYNLRMDSDSAPIPMTVSGKASPMMESLSDLRGVPAPARPAIGLTGLLSNAIYSEPGQAVLRTVVSNRPEGVGLIGDYLRDEIGLGTAVRGLLSGPR